MAEGGLLRKILPGMATLDDARGTVGWIIFILGLPSGASMMAYLENAPKFYWYIGFVLCFGIALCAFFSFKAYANSLKVVSANTAPQMKGGPSFPTMTKTHFEDILEWKRSRGLSTVYIQEYSINLANIIDTDRVISEIHFLNCRFVGHAKAYGVNCVWSQKQKFENNDLESFEIFEGGALDDRITLFKCTIDRCHFTKTKISILNGDSFLATLKKQSDFNVGLS